MAETFGLIAGVLQVAGFGAEVSSTLFKCAKKFHNASKELEEIARQVDTIAISLRRVHDLLNDPTTKALHTQKLYEDTNTVSKGCSEVFRELDDTITSLEPRSGFGKLAFRSKWLFDSSKLHGLGNVLRRYSDVLHLMISVMAIVEGRRAATKDELQALEADLKLLAISNKDLSHSNKTLTDTLASMSRAHVNPIAPKATNPHLIARGVGGTGISRSMFETSLITMPFIDHAPIVSPTTSSSDRMADRLQSCMKAVHELALTISCALNTLHGHEKTGSSDVHGCYAKLSAEMASLPTHVQCNQCKQNVALCHFEPARNGMGQLGVCRCRHSPPPSPESPCCNYSKQEGYESIEELNGLSHLLETTSQNDTEYGLSNAAVTEPEAQGQQHARPSDTSRLSTAPLSSSNLPDVDIQHCGSAQQHQLNTQVLDKNGADCHSAHQSLNLSERYQYPPQPTIATTGADQRTASPAASLKPAQHDDDSECFSSGDKPAQTSRKPSPFEWLGGTQQREPLQVGRKKNPQLSREARDRSSRMCMRASTMAKRRPRLRKSTAGVNDIRHDQDNFGGNQRRHEEQHIERQPPLDNDKYPDSVGGRSQNSECLDLDLDLDDSVGNRSLDSKSNYRQNLEGVQDMTNMTNDRLIQSGHVDSILGPQPFLHHSQSLESSQQINTSMPQQASQPWPTQRPVSPGAYLAHLAGLEAQNKKRLLIAREDQDPWRRRQAIWPFSSDESSAIDKKSYCSIEDKMNIKKSAVEKTRQAAVSEPEQPAIPTPLEPLKSTGNYADEHFGMNMDFADVSAGGADILDNFDFDSFLNRDDSGICFSFPVFDGGLEGSVGDTQDHAPESQMYVGNAPQHGQKRSHSDAFSECPERAATSPRQRRLVELCEPSVPGFKRPAAESNNNEMSIESLSGIEALLQRWLDASATSVLLRGFDG